MNDENKKIMANNIKKYMEIKGVTNQQVCDALGFKYTTFMDWIKAVTYPRIGKVEAMANYFGCAKSDLIEDKLNEEDQKKNDTLTDIIVRMRMDEEFLALVESLYPLDSEKIKGVKQLLNAFTK